MRSREIRYRESIPEIHYVRVWKLAGMPSGRICIVMFRRGTWMIRDSDIISLTGPSWGVTGRARTFLAAQSALAHHCMWIWKSLVCRSAYGNKTIYEAWQIAESMCSPAPPFSWQSLHPPLHPCCSYGACHVLAKVTPLFYNGVILAKLDGPNNGHLTHPFP